MDEKKSLSRECEQLKLLGTQVLLIFALILGLITASGTIWIISRLRLAKESQAIEYNEQNEGQLVFNQDLMADTLLPQENLTLNMVLGEQIEISGSSDGNKQARILLQGNSINMQAKVYSSGSDRDQYSFGLPKRLDILDVPHGAKNVKVIRAPSLRKGYVKNKANPNLEIKSLQQLDISGNMGLKLHARQMLIQSPDSIVLDTKEGSISINSKALRMPAIVHGASYFREILDWTNRPEDTLTDSNHQATTNKYQLCIGRDDGLVFQSTKGTCQSL